MKKWAARLLSGVFVLVALAGAVTYSWTYTPYGRLDYFPAVFAKAASWDTSPLEISAAARERNREMVASFAAPVPFAQGVQFRDRTIPRADGTLLPVRIYTPDVAGPMPIYIDIHGGGWWLGDGYPVHNLNSHFAQRAGVIVVSVEYRLVPEHRFPSALDDCYLALQWLHEHGQEIGGDPSRIAVGGGSAGGNLAAALTIRARDEQGPPISFQFLFVPATDLSGTNYWPSYAEMQDDYVLKVSGIEAMINAYLPDSTDRMLPTASPLLADDHSNLPAAFIVTAQFDPLRDEAEAYSQALADAGVQTTLYREPGALHGFIGSSSKMVAVYYKAADRLRAHFSTN